jgi:poly(hydroxyalkanoate) depolymerase family esterase
MKPFPSMLAATRLTQAGKLAEASDVMRRLFGRHAAPEAAPRAAPAGGAGQFLDRSFTGPAGKLAYKLYVPRQATAGAPLVVMLHGCTQSPEDFAAGTRMNALADTLGLLIAYPAQARTANAQKCWNWFAPDHQARDRGEPALIAGLTREIIAGYGADPTRVFVAGLSAGGAAAAVMAEAYPELYAAVGVHSGLACGAARDLSSAMQAMQRGGGRPGAATRLVPTITFHGDRDTTVNEANAGEVVARAAGAARGLTTETSDGTSKSGRRYTRAVSRDASGRAMIEQWTIHGAGHAWSGGDAAGSYTDPQGPDASSEMLRFFLQR